MYRVGFGDCFLISFRGRRTFHALVDCGVHNQGDIGTLEETVKDIASETGGRLGLIIASHAHEDHISGFARHADLFREFSIGEIWLPWTEDPRDRLASRLRRKRAAVLARLQAHFAARPPSAFALAALTNLAAARNQTALDNLRSGFGSEVALRYLQAGDEVREPGGIPGLTARLLGPPRDQAFLKKMDPPKAERFLRIGPAGEVVPEHILEPFEAEHTRPNGSEPALSTADAALLRKMAEGSFEGLAFTLNQAMNNTSLVALFSYRGRSLLFPGDAQFGNWKYWIEGDDATETLSQIEFYKVSHHGSENATPKSALDGMTHARFAAMVSTQSKPWPSIPYDKLMGALSARAGEAIVRSDSLGVTGAPKGPVVRRLAKGFRAGRFWYDYEIPV